MRPYDWMQDAPMDFEHPVDLLLRGEKDPDAIRFAMAAHLSEMSLSTQQSCEAIDLALVRMEKALGYPRP